MDRSIKQIKVKLTRDAIGGMRMVTEDDELLQNVFVKEYHRVEGSVMRLNVDLIFLVQDDNIKNW